jgi:hypothetical protein
MAWWRVKDEYLCYHLMSPGSDVAVQIGKERREHAAQRGMRPAVRWCRGYGGGVEGERTLANSFASWPPWLMAGYVSRVTGERGLNACACAAVARSGYRSPLLAS